MRKVAACIAVVVFAASISAPPPAAAFGLRIGPFHFGVPFLPHWGYRHRLYMHANPNELAHGAPTRPPASPLLYPGLGLAAVFQSIFFPADAPAWPFGYARIFSTAFARSPANGDPRLCQPAVDGNAIVNRIRAEVAPTADQEPALQKLGGALGAAAGFLAKGCATEIPAQPVARLQLMESEIEELAMAIDIVRQPLQDFEQSLDADQLAKFAAAPPATPQHSSAGEQDSAAAACDGASSSIDWSIDEIDKSVRPTPAQRQALDDVKTAFADAASDLQAHCPTTVQPTPLARQEAIEARLDATWRSELAIQVALATFQTKLSAEQKSRFDRLNFAAR